MRQKSSVLFAVFIALKLNYCNAAKSNIPGQRHEAVQRKFDEAKWEKIVKDIDYSDERRLIENVPAKPRSWKLSEFNINPLIAKSIIFTLVIGALGFLLFKIFGKNIFKKNPGLKAENLFSEEGINEETPVDGLEKLLNQVLSKKMFREAIRIYYLMIIRGLSERNLILWKKDKSNREYLFEMRAHPSFASFKEATFIFETAWYRNVSISDNDFISVKPKFENLILSITSRVNEQ